MIYIGISQECVPSGGSCRALTGQCPKAADTGKSLVSQAH